MLSVSSLASAGDAGKYYAQDNYYSSEQSAEANSEWFGKGAQGYGLEGQVKADKFERVLEGELPDGTMRQASPNGQNRPGIDLTFSAPKSVSLLALVGGDDKVREAHVAAVMATLAFAEKHLAETRLRGADRKLTTQQTGNLLVALFHHDSSRRLDPQLHTHAVIANLTQRGDGKWVSLKNDQLWSLNTTLGAIYNGHLRNGLEKLGYETLPAGKHGSFEVVGFSREAIMAFSQRRAEIVDVLDQLGASGLKAGQTVALKTRPPKREAELAAKQNHWSVRLAAVGLDLQHIMGDARHRADSRDGVIASLGQNLKGLAFNARQFAEKIYAAFGGREQANTETFRPTKPWTLTAEQITAGEATGAAIRHLSEREAVFSAGAILKSALEFAPQADPEKILGAMSRLVKDKRLLTSAGKDQGFGQTYTTRAAWQVERQVLEEASKGIGASQPILSPEKAISVLDGHGLNPAQLRAAQLILTSQDRTVAVQGVAGAGKSYMISALADAAKAEGRHVIGLAHMNKVVRDLSESGQIPGMTITRFLRTHGSLAAEAVDPARLEMARAMFKGSVIVVDEAGTLKSGQMRDLLALANQLQVGRVALVGDTRQLGAIEQGKPFANQQERGLATAQLDINIRQSNVPVLASASQFARDGQVEKAIETLSPYIRESGRDGVSAVLQAYKSLTPAERDKTLVLPQTREARHALNIGIQEILKSEGEITGEGRTLRILEPVNATVEERRHVSLYQPGDELTFMRPVTSAGISGGTLATVESINAEKKTMVLKTAGGARFAFEPGSIKPNSKVDSLIIRRPAAVTLYEGDKIRWTGNDIERGIANSDTAKIVDIGADKITVETATRTRLEIGTDDKMMGQLNLAYAQTIHSAQGSTAGRVLGLMEARNATLSSQANFYVVISRMREELTLFVDDKQRLSDQLKRLTGEKTSALDALDPNRELRIKSMDDKETDSRMKDRKPDQEIKPETQKEGNIKADAKIIESKVADLPKPERSRKEPEIGDAGSRPARTNSRDFGI
jgi:conjugative relaxase-like TrwC/TraI family protein